MTWILAIDTSGLRCGVALVQDGEPAGVEELAAPGTNRALMPAIERLCRRAGIGPRHLDGVAVALGPGSFTGLRIGLAAAKGLAVALDRPLAGVGTLDAVALAAVGDRDRTPDTPARPERGTRVWLVARPARRGEYYVAIYRDERSGRGAAGDPGRPGTAGPAPGPGPRGAAARERGAAGPSAAPAAGREAAAIERLWGPDLVPAAVLQQWLAGPPVLPPGGPARNGEWRLQEPPASASRRPAQRPGTALPLEAAGWGVVMDPAHRTELGLEASAAAPAGAVAPVVPATPAAPSAPAGPGSPGGLATLPDPGAVPVAVARLALPRLAAGGDDPATLAPVYLPAGSTFRPYPHPMGPEGS